ncbi:MAG: hypothetical protein AB2810_09105 [Candidatus Thiodiazotropha endolucinida]
MKKSTIALTVCGLFTLAGCTKPNDAETSKSATDPSPITEQNVPALTEQVAEGDAPMEQTEQAAFEIDTVKDKPEEGSDAVDKMSDE